MEPFSFFGVPDDFGFLFFDFQLVLRFGAYLSKRKSSFERKTPKINAPKESASSLFFIFLYGIFFIIRFQYLNELEAHFTRKRLSGFGGGCDRKDLEMEAFMCEKLLTYRA